MSMKKYDFDEATWLTFLESIYDGICVYNKDGYPVYANAAHMKNLGFIGDEFWRKSLHELWHADPPVVSEPVSLHVGETGEPATGMVTYYRTGKTCMVSARPIYWKDGEILVASTIHDMTDLLRLQEQVNMASTLQETYRERIQQLEDPILVRTKSKIMSDIFEKAGRVSNVSAPVLLLGETGVGKDFLANYIHKNSSMTGSFIKVNCGAIPDNLMESELFGYERGAFTGANKGGKPGLIELADNGTLYLDEIADLPLNLQVKLLGVLQDRQVTRLGSTTNRPVNFRVIAATNANLKDRIANGTFRADLYYRLNVVSFYIPPLRERPEDILPLATFFLEQLNRQYHKQTFFDPRAIRLMTRYNWPGNIRELKNTLERIVVLINSPCISEGMIERNLLFLESSDSEKNADISDTSHIESLKESVARYEQLLIAEAIRKHGTLAAAAEALQIDISTLVRKKRKKIT